MGGANVTLQVAAALDRRGITAWADNQEVVVLIDHDGTKMRIRRRKYGRKPNPPEWEWGSEGDDLYRHPLDDYEGLAAAFEKYVRDNPEFAGTRVLYRMNHMGWTWQEEDQETIEKAHESIARDPEKVADLTRMGDLATQVRSSPSGRPNRGG